ncbi:MAG: hydrogenase maturation protease [Candidatus Sericytochromatia bacterium]
MKADLKCWLRVIGLGQLLRGDDALGLLAAQQLQQQFPGLEVLCCGGEASELYYALLGAERVLLLDALQAGKTVGTLIELDPRVSPLPQEWCTSTHAFGLTQALALAETLEDLPPWVRILGLQAGSFALGSGLTSAVAAAMPQLLARATAIITEWRQDSNQGESHA